MLISHNWLRELTDTKLDPQEVRERLTSVGLAVDAVEERDGDYVLDVEVPSNRGDCLSHVGIARGMACRNVQGIEIIEIRFDLSIVLDRITERDEDVFNSLAHQGDRMQMSGTRTTTGNSHVDGFAFDTSA